MIDPIHAQTHENLQLGEGVLLRGADLDAMLLSGDPAGKLAEILAERGRLIGATKAGCVFRCIPTIVDTTRGMRTPAVGETLIGRWEVTLSGTLLEVTPENASLLFNQPLYEYTGGQAVMAPDPDPAPAANTDVCWVGDTGCGLLAIEIRCPVSIGGMVFRATRGGLGEADFTLLAHKRSPEESCIPFRMLWMKEARA